MQNNNEEELNDSIQELTRVSKKLCTRHSLWYGFIYGIFVAIGSSLGIAIALTLFVYALAHLQNYPFITEAIKNALPFLEGR